MSDSNYQLIIDEQSYIADQVLGSPPSFLFRYGVAIVSFAIAFALAFAYWVPFNKTMEFSITLVPEQPVAVVKGLVQPMQWLVSEGEEVNTNDPIATSTNGNQWHAPINGVVNRSDLTGLTGWQEPVELFRVIPVDSSSQRAFIKVDQPQQFEVGQTGVVEMEAFPALEFGYLTGTVINVINTKEGSGLLVVEVAPPFISSTDHTLAVGQGGEGHLELVIGQYTLFERMLGAR